MRLLRFSVPVIVIVGAFVLGHAWSQQDEPEHEAPAWTLLTEHHAKLKESVGVWAVTGEVYTAPGAPPEKFTATAKREMILDGRFLVETFESTFMGHPFEGRLLQGYDTINKEYVSIWVDNMSPHISIGRGKPRDDGMVLKGKDPDFMTGQMKETKSVLKFVSEDEVHMQMSDVTDGSERLAMKFVYKRKKTAAGDR